MRDAEGKRVMLTLRSHPATTTITLETLGPRRGSRGKVLLTLGEATILMNRLAQEVAKVNARNEQ